MEKNLTITDTQWAVSNFQQMLEFGTHLLKSGFLPQAVKTPQQVVAIILKGQEMGIPPMEALAQINVIQGKPTMSASLMLSLAYKKIPGFSASMVESSDKVCTMEFSRPGCPPHRHSFTIDDAKALGLFGKDNWVKQARTMLQWRAVSAGLRFYAPDAISGIYTPEEIDPDTKIDPETQAIAEERKATIVSIETPRLANVPIETSKEDPIVVATEVFNPAKIEQIDYKTGEITNITEETKEKVKKTKNAHQKPFWISDFKGKNYLFANTGSCFTSEFLSESGMKESKTKGKYYCVYSPVIMGTLNDKFTASQNVDATEEPRQEGEIFNSI